MRYLFCLLVLFALSGIRTVAQSNREFYQIRVYHIKNDAQLLRVESYLEKALLPALHKEGISKVGVFRPAKPDTAGHRLFVLIPYRSFADIPAIEDRIQMSAQVQKSGAGYADAPHSDPPYTRMETILLQAFKLHPALATPALKGPRDQRIYELRSYEGHTEKIFRNKVHMFNEGGEIALFERLGFNAVFYGEVVAGCRMPNLMYMTSFKIWKSATNTGRLL